MDGVSSGLDDIPEITAMRGYASLGVVVYHMLVITNLWMPTLYTSMALTWNTGVDFFFVLSGFLLSAPFIAQAGGGRTSGTTTSRGPSAYSPSTISAS